MSQIGIRSQFVPFDSKICDLIDSREQKIFKKFDKNQFEVRLIRFYSTSMSTVLLSSLDFILFSTLYHWLELF